MKILNHLAKVASIVFLTFFFIQCKPINTTGVKNGYIEMEKPGELYRLTGKWLFHSGNGTENAPADDSKDWRTWIVPDGQETLKLDATETHPSWLRIDFKLSSEYEGKNLAFLIPPNGNYSIFLNGEKIRNYVNYGEIVQTGSTVVQFESKFLRLGNNTLRIMGDRLIGISGPNPDILIGDPEAINSKLLLRWAWTSTIVGIFVFLAFYHFVMYLKRPQAKSYLWLAVILIGNASFSFFAPYLAFKFFEPSSWTWIMWWLTLPIQFVSMLFFFYSVFDYEMKGRFVKYLLIAMITWALFPISDFLINDWTKNTFKIGIPLLGPISLTLYILLYKLLFRAIKDQQTSAKTITLGFTVYIIATFNDQLVNQNVFLNPLIIGEGTLFFMVSLTFAQGVRFAKVHDDLDKSYKTIEEYNKTLELKVEQRTEELKKTLDEVQALKVQQDGDYFLTSLLLQPLGRNYANSKNVMVKFFLKQKKEFSFRDKQKEIGGDINIAHTITIANRPHTVFMNGDAMGKSVQGAGGALVLGAIFQSIIERTKVTRSEQTKSPERWLKDTFIELHKVFESFDGSMLMSIVLGLVDDDSGFLYYINAEHPFTILFRDKKASFIEDNVELRKLGTTGISGQFNVKTFTLENSDAIIAGSDGRDDVLLGFDEETGARIINEDEEKFLETLEKGEGNIEDTYELLKKQGELTDDTSLIKVIFNNPHLAKFREAAKAIKSKADAELKAGDIENGIKTYNLYLEKMNSDEEAMISVADIAQKNDKVNLTIEYRERYLLRHPENEDNIVILAKIYHERGNIDRAGKLANMLTTKKDLAAMRDILQESRKKEMQSSQYK
jgi:hypothetical protein